MVPILLTATRLYLFTMGDPGKRLNYFYMIDGSGWATLGYL